MWSGLQALTEHNRVTTWLPPSLQRPEHGAVPDYGPDALARAFPPAHLRRLRDLKRRWDPIGLCRDDPSIDPTTPHDADAPSGRPKEDRVPVPTRRQHP